MDRLRNQLMKLIGFMLQVMPAIGIAVGVFGPWDTIDQQDLYGFERGSPLLLVPVVAIVGLLVWEWRTPELAVAIRFVTGFAYVAALFMANQLMFDGTVIICVGYCPPNFTPPWGITLIYASTIAGAIIAGLRFLTVGVFDS